MTLFETAYAKVPDLNERGARLRFLGRRQHLPSSVLEAMAEAEELTAHNDKLDVCSPQLRRPVRDRGRRQRIVQDGLYSRGGGRGDLRLLPLRSRGPRGRPRDPDERRAARLELPALADSIRRVLRDRHVVAGLLTGGVPAGHRIFASRSRRRGGV